METRIDDIVAVIYEGQTICTDCAEPASFYKGDNVTFITSDDVYKSDAVVFTCDECGRIIK